MLVGKSQMDVSEMVNTNQLVQTIQLNLTK